MESYVIRANELREEAAKFLQVEGLIPLFSSYGDVLFAGSCELDLMTWKDIDLNIIVPKDKRRETANMLAQDFIVREDVDRIKILRDLRAKYGEVMPDSEYVGIKMHGWKLDIHIVDEKDATATKDFTESIRALLTEENRERILYWKDQFLTREGRSIKFSSMHIYNAILKERLDDESDIKYYLQKHGVVIS